jgi:hypothetical protein
MSYVIAYMLGPPEQEEKPAPIIHTNLIRKNQNSHIASQRYLG